MGWRRWLPGACCAGRRPTASRASGCWRRSASTPPRGWAVARGDAALGLRLGGALWRFWWVRGHLTEGRERLAALLALPGAAARTPGRAQALAGAGGLAFYHGDYAAAHALLA